MVPIAYLNGKVGDDFIRRGRVKVAVRDFAEVELPADHGDDLPALASTVEVDPEPFGGPHDDGRITLYLLAAYAGVADLRGTGEPPTVLAAAPDPAAIMDPGGRRYLAESPGRVAADIP
jgi:hypothetical protein